MKGRLLLVLVAVFAMSAAVYGQTTLTGKWQTDNVPAALAAQAAAPATPEAGGRGARGGGGGQAIIMDLKADGTKVTGTVNEIGNGDPLTIETGTVAGKTITLVTQPRGVTWNIEMTDDNTISVMSRVFAARGGAELVAAAVVRVPVARLPAQRPALRLAHLLPEPVHPVPGLELLERAERLLAVERLALVAAVVVAVEQVAAAAVAAALLSFCTG